MRYAGIGSRKTPDYALFQIRKIAANLAKRGATLFSGYAKGADQAFYQGAKSVGGKSFNFLPWNGFNGAQEDANEFIVPKYNYKFVKLLHQFHPQPHKLSEGGRKLMMRNSCQVLGMDLVSPVDFVVCWTLGGRISGGTGQAIRIANYNNIPVFNLGGNGLDELRDYLKLELSDE